ncbi:MAG TPA: FAD-dependent oxidoreductase [Ramlibacter sp.]|uniref:oxidoreductase n=1 Tax=Ramlibacter sp. TaxID=1917967 RepID=UPI002D7EA690|nr:FAD-dependent oxidoreductase [Ramlibacter sp.]HET8748134.1 FAD-dependent oxidoreductase [Ramlibacter sp.]
MKPGEAKLPHLFQPARLGRFATRNRIKYGACCVSNYNTRDGFITEREIARMKVIARTGCGIITNQGAYPDPMGEGKAYFRQVAIFDDRFLPQFERIAADIKANGAVAIQQILHAGRYGGIDLGYCIQPSDVPQTLPHFRPPKVMTKEEIRDCIRQHAEAADRAIRAGFDGTEITSFMGYLLANFNSRFTNQRTDEYGGSIANRGRFMRELIDGIKQATPDNPLVVRLNGAELMDRWGGNTEDECFELMQQAVDAGVDMISVTVGWQEAPESSIGRDIPPGYWNYLSERAKKTFPDTLITFGNRLPDPRMADQCLRDGIFDFWEVCRPLLADPELIHKAAEDRLDEVRRCIGSLNCLSRLFRDLPYTCTMNPALGHEVEPEYQVTPATVKKKIMVIGAGPAGMECAITARKRGHEVTVFEKAPRIGGNLYAYAINDLARPDDLLSVIDHYEVVAKKLGIEVRLNTEVHAKFMRSVLHQYDVCVVAAGARIDRERYAHIPGAERMLDALDVAHGRVKAGQRVVVVGGGKIGLTLAESLRKHQGAEVTVVEQDKRIAGDVKPSFKWRHASWVEELGIPCRTSTRLVKVDAEGATVVSASGEETLLPADSVILATQMAPAHGLFGEFEWMVDELHGAGDALIPRGLEQAIQEGFRLGVRL